MSSTYSRQFSCPLCALKAWLIQVLNLQEQSPVPEPFFESLVKVAKGRGLVPPDYHFWLDAKQGTVLQPQHIERLPIGSEIPAFQFAAEICATCGTVYAARLERATAKRTVQRARTMPQGQTLKIPCHEINLQIDRLANTPGAQGRHLQGVRHEVHRKIAVTVCNPNRVHVVNVNDNRCNHLGVYIGNHHTLRND